MLFFQIVLYCLLYLLLVKCAVRDSGRNCLYFIPRNTSPRHSGGALRTGMK